MHINLSATHILRVIWIVEGLRVEYDIAVPVGLEIASYFFAEDSFCFFAFDNQTRMVCEALRVGDCNLLRFIYRESTTAETHED